MQNKKIQENKFKNCIPGLMMIEAKNIWFYFSKKKNNNNNTWYNNSRIWWKHSWSCFLNRAHTAVCPKWSTRPKKLMKEGE